MITAELKDFLESGLSMLVGTCDGRGQPTGIRGLGARVEADGRELVAFVPDVTAARTLADLRENPRLAVTFGRPEDHRTIQVKGRLLELQPADERDRACIDEYRVKFAHVLAFIGMPPGLTARIAHWPSHRLRLRVEQVFVQTPGPQAGMPLPPGPGGSR